MKQLLKNSGILMIGELFTKLLSVLYLIPLIRINENIGILNATVTIPFGLFVVFGTLGINILLTSEITKRKDYPSRLRSCLITALCLLIILSVTSALVLFFNAHEIVDQMISDHSYITEITKATKILSIGVILFAILAYLRTIINAFGYFQVSSFSYIFEQIIKVSIILICSFIFIYQKQMDVGIYAIILAIAIVISMLVTLCYYLHTIYKKSIYRAFLEGNIHISKKLVKHLLIGGIVILAASIYASSYEMIDLMMMQNYLKSIVSNSENDLIRGIYFTSSWKLVFIPISIAGSIITVMMTKIGGDTKNDGKHFDNVFNLTLLFGIIAMLLLILCGERAYYFLYGEFSQNIIIFQALLIPFYTLRNVLGTYIVSADGKKSSIIVSLIIMIIAKIIFNLIFMQMFGYIGVVFSSILTISISIIYLYKTNQELFNISKLSYKVKGQIVIITPILMGIFLMISKVIPSYNFISAMCLAILGIIIIFITYRKIFKRMVRISHEQ